jgi:YbgC/YbaW family acyl-CoA thioester hydrolase
MATDGETPASPSGTRVVTEGSDAQADYPGCVRRGLARITVYRRVEWADTDAAGHHHFSAPLRWVEHAESLLYDRLGIVDFIAALVPRVHFDIDYFSRLQYRDMYELTLVVKRLGRSSLTYRFEIKSADQMVAEGSLVVVLTGLSDRKPRPWPEQVRSILAEAGDQSR